MGPTNFKMFGSIGKVEDQPDGTIKVYGIASTPSIDGAGERITAKAMKAAIPDYSKFPALREMHQPSAAGKVLEAEVDDQGATNIVAHVVDPVAIVKVKTGVYSGFSVGGKVLKRDPTDRSIIDSLKLVEISLVDSPCNPDAILSMWKADLMPDFKPVAADVVARAKILAKANGNSPRFRDFLFEAGEELRCEAMLKADEADQLAQAEAEAALEADAQGGATQDPPAEAAEPAAEAAAAAEPIAEAAAAEAAPGEPEAAKEAAASIDPEDTDTGGEFPAGDEIGKGKVVDPAVALAAALESGREAIRPQVAASTVAAPLVPFEDLGKAAAALKGLSIKGDELGKSLYHVSRMADLLSSFASLQGCVAAEAAREGDGSAMPAMMADQVKAMGECLVMCAQEEVAELIAGMGDDDAEITIVFADDYFEYSQAIVDLVKASPELMEAAQGRLAKAAPLVNVTVEADAAALLAENERLSKALADAVPAVDELTKSFGETLGELQAKYADLEKKLEGLDQQVLPPKTAGPAIVQAVQKGADSAGNAAPLDLSMSDEQLEKAFAALSDEERGKILVKASLARPMVVAQRS